ncbi:hypothetical protein L9F63_009098 [Diploptera punctata]|uniref:Interleukin-1 n=1 Tax=Diploptera punctata TaxID=6984 RepID=A0AAD7Z3X6_DIPPU|nr:hypothetical protein L9F63_009098 [Diploptera punctata]
MFPSVKNPERITARLKNLEQQVYVCVTTDDVGKNKLGTKTRNLDLLSDPELEFTLYFFTSAEANNTKMVLPVHESTKCCLSMSPEKNLELTTLREGDSSSNEVDTLEDPNKITQADSRFFYVKSSGTNIALEAMNGTDANYYLAVSEKNQVVIEESTDSNYPENILFSLDTFQ